MNKFKKAFGSWETTLAGVAAAVAAWGNALAHQFDGIDTTDPDWTLAVSLTFVAIGLLRARDNNKKSEVVGAK